MEFDFRDQISTKSDKELLHIYKNSDQYQEQFIIIVEEELQKRNLEYKGAKRNNDNRNKILDELAQKGQAGDQVYIAIGFISALLGGVLGIIIGYNYSRSRHTGLSGSRFFVYDQKTRELGTIMMVLGIVVIIVSLILRF